MQNGDNEEVNERLEAQSLDVFWKFIHERQKVWVRRHVENRSPPWTKNDILRKYRFTNVYRILDPGTQYVVEAILNSEHTLRDRLFNCILYRILGRRRTHSDLGMIEVSSFTSQKLEEQLRTIEKEGKHPVFTGAYTVAPYHQFDGQDKIENISLLAEVIAENLESLLSDLQKAKNLEGTYEGLRRVPGLGRFLAFQVAVDLTYPLRGNNGEGILSHSSDEWAIAGPGARRGLAILKNGGTPGDLEVMSWLRDNQVHEFERRSLDFSFLKNPKGEPKLLSMADIQNCLCEFSKYCRIGEDPASARRRFREKQVAASSFHVNSVSGWMPG